MKDFEGKELNVGDKILWIDNKRSSACFRKGIIVKTTDYLATIEFNYDNTRSIPFHIRKSSNYIYKL